MTNRIYKDDEQALGALKQRLVVTRWSYSAIEAEQSEALERAISALRSAQDVERRIVEARIDELRAVEEIHSTVTDSVGYYLYERAADLGLELETINKRISELRASLAKEGE